MGVVRFVCPASWIVSWLAHWRVFSKSEVAVERSDNVVAPEPPFRLRLKRGYKIT
jgi:hypothetical protein